jgi:eukaryotic-like serine/threonine-protein kinase
VYAKRARSYDAPVLDILKLRDSLCGLVLTGSSGVRIHLLSLHGEGLQGWVYKAAWDRHDGSPVALKVLRPDAVSLDAHRRFRREAEVLRQLSEAKSPSPYIVRFLDHFEGTVLVPSAGYGTTTQAALQTVLPCTALEFVSGPNLAAAIEVLGRGFPVARARRLLRHVTTALELVHSQGIIHRDLKPSNVLLHGEGDGELAKVTDFGLVKVEAPEVERTKALAGATLGYAPPEQFERENNRVSARTDVFSLAAMLFEMLSGTRAFPKRAGENPIAVLTRMLQNPAPKLSACEALVDPALRPHLPALDLYLAKALAPDPGLRYPSPEALWEALDPILAEADHG